MITEEDSQRLVADWKAASDDERDRFLQEQGIVAPGEPIAQEAPQPQLPSSPGEVERERRLFDRASGIEASIGGLRIVNMAEVMDVAKMMSMSGSAVPDHCRQNVGMCFAICLQAMEWKMSPFAVANKSYVTNDRLNYESQLVHAVIEARAPLRERLRVRYEGTGDDMICIVSGWFRNEAEPREHRSKPLKDARPPSKTKDGKSYVLGSPLWAKKPEVQMFYDTSRDFCRIYCPDVLLGIYTPDEIEQYGSTGEAAQDITEQVDAAAALHQRLAQTAQNGEGFREGVVEAGLAEAAGEAVGEGVATPTAAKPGKRTGGHRPVDARVSERLAEVNKPKTVRPTRATARNRAPSAAAKPSASARATAAGKAGADTTKGSDGPVLRTPKDYEWHMKGWLAVLEDPDEVEERWKNEWKLRRACGCSGGDAATELLKMKNARVKELAS